MRAGRFRFAARVALCAVLAAVACAAHVPAHTAAQYMAVQPDGKILLAGRSSEWLRARGGALLRLNPDGTLDRGFGARGQLIDFRLEESFGPLAVKPNGRIVITVSSGLRLVELFADGRPNQGFGASGVAAGPPLPNGMKHGPELPRAILVGPGESLIVGGETLAHSSVDEHSFSEALRFAADGGFEVRLGALERGVPSPALRSARLTDLLLRDDGSLVAAAHAVFAGRGAALLARFSPGAYPYDPSFGGVGGLLTLDPFPQAEGPAGANAIAPHGAGLILAGTAADRLLVARLDPDGTLDGGFGEAGVVGVAPPQSLAAAAGDVAVQADGKIVVAGRTIESCGGEAPYSACPKLFVARFQSSGQLDSSFGTGGFVRLRAAREAEHGMPRVDLALLADGKMLLGGALSDEQSALAVARLDPSGNLDPSFGKGGIAAAAPCQAGTEWLRRIGCLSTARVRFRFIDAGPRRLGIELRVTASQPLDPLRGLVVYLPSWLEARRPQLRQRIRVREDEGRGARVKVRPHSVHLTRLGRSESISVTIPRGSFKRWKRGKYARPAPFGLRVSFADGFSQAFQVRRSGRSAATP